MVFDNIRKSLEKDAKRGDLDIVADGQPLSVRDFQLDEDPEFTCDEGSVRRGHSCGR